MSDNEFFSKNFDVKLPKGYSVFIKTFPIKGIGFERASAIEFIRSEDQILSLELEHLNVSDENAIKIIGGTAGEGLFLGYVPKNHAKHIVDSGMFSQLIPKIRRVYHSSQDYVDINLQIIGPIELRKNFMMFEPVEMATDTQIKFLEFACGLFKNDLSLLEAHEIILNHVKAGLNNFNKYESIMEELTSDGFAESYGMDPVDQIRVDGIISILISEGDTFESLMEDSEGIYDRIIGS